MTLVAVSLVAVSLLLPIGVVARTPVAGPGVDMRVLVPLVAGLNQRAVLTAVELTRTEPGRPRHLRPVRHVGLRSRATALVGILAG
jgi:hypothetical protein